MKHSQFKYNKKLRFTQGAAALIAGAVVLGGSVLGGHGHLISLAADTASQLPLKGEAIGALVIPGKRAVNNVPPHPALRASRTADHSQDGPQDASATPQRGKPLGRVLTLRGVDPALCVGIEAPEIEPEPEPQEAAPWWTEEELELLACTIYCEAGSDSISDETRLMVGQVVINRVNHPDYPGTIEEVLTQRGQYGRFFWTGVVWPSRAGRSVEAHAVERAYDCAERVLGGEWLLPTDVIYQAGFVQGREIVASAPGFYFCR